MKQGICVQHDGSTYKKDKRPVMIEADLWRIINYGGGREPDRKLFPDTTKYPPRSEGAFDNVNGPNNFYLSLAGIFQKSWEPNWAINDRFFACAPAGRSVIVPIGFFPPSVANGYPASAREKQVGMLMGEGGPLNWPVVKDMVREYVSRNAGRVWMYEAFNEPLVQARTYGGPEVVAELTRILAEAVYDLDPGALIGGSPLSNIRGGSASYWQTLFDAVDSTGTRMCDYLDVVSVHTYCYPEGTTHHPDEVGAVHLDYWVPKFIEDVLAPRELQDLPLVASEFGIEFAYTPTNQYDKPLLNPDGTPQHIVLTEAEAAARVISYFDAHERNGFAAACMHSHAGGPMGQPLSYDISRSIGGQRGWNQWRAKRGSR